MKIETTRTFENATYLLSDPEMASMMSEGGVSIRDLSPLGQIDMSRIPRTPPEDYAELAGAIAILAAPNRVLQLRTWPDGGGWVRYYGAQGTADMVVHSRNSATGSNMIIWPVSQNMLKSTLTAPLARGVNATTALPSFTLQMSELLVLAALVDYQQEVVLQSFVDRNPTPKVLFTTPEIAAVYARGLAGDSDPRWLVARMVHGISVPLPDTLSVIQKTLERFCNIGLLVEDRGGYTPLPSASIIFRQLAEIDGMSALEVQASDGLSPLRRIYHANHAQIWRYELPADMDMRREVTLAAITTSDLQSDLEKLLPKFTKTKELTCPSCGAATATGQKFCVECGARL